MAKKRKEESSGSGTLKAIGLSLLGVSAVGLAAGIGAAIGASAADDPQLRKRVKRLERKAKTARRRMNRLEDEAGSIEIITPAGCYGTDLFEDQEDLEA